jgi:hypothetical protein
MLELIGTTLLTASIAINLYAAVTTMPLSPVQKLTTVSIAGLWIGLAIAMAGAGAYASVPVVGLMVALPVVGIGAMALLSTRVRETLLALPIPLLTGLNILRIIPGASMVLLAWQGQLSGPFPQSAGWGDIIAGAVAIPVTIAAARNFAASRGAVLAWNLFGTADLVAAIALAALSAPTSPIQIFGGLVGSTAMASLPWSTIPTLLVPFYLILHGIIFAQLARANGKATA